MEAQVVKEMETIVIKDILKLKMADDDIKGDKIFEKLKEKQENGCKEILLDFKGIELVNTAFLNNAIGKLFDMAQFDLTKCHVNIVGMDETMIDLLKEAIRVARQKYQIRDNL